MKMIHVVRQVRSMHVHCNACFSW